MRLAQEDFLDPFSIPEFPSKRQPYYIEGILKSEHYKKSKQKPYGVIYLRPIDKPTINFEQLMLLDRRSNDKKTGQDKLGPYKKWLLQVGSEKVLRVHKDEDDRNIKTTYATVERFMQGLDWSPPLDLDLSSILKRYNLAIEKYRSHRYFQYLYDVRPSKEINEFLEANWDCPLTQLGLSHPDNEISGLTVPWLQIGPFGCSTPDHIEDHGLYSVNFNYGSVEENKEQTNTTLESLPKTPSNAPDNVRTKPKRGRPKGSSKSKPQRGRPESPSSYTEKAPAYKFGGHKLWVFVLDEDKDKYEKCKMAAIEEALGTPARPCHIKRKEFFIPLQTLVNEGIRFKLILQAPGDIIITLPGTFHQVINLEFAICSSKNFVTTCKEDLKKFTTCTPCPCVTMELSNQEENTPIAESTPEPAQNEGTNWASKYSKRKKKSTPEEGQLKSCYGHFPILNQMLEKAVQVWEKEFHITGPVKSLLEDFNMSFEEKLKSMPVVPFPEDPTKEWVTKHFVETKEEIDEEEEYLANIVHHSNSVVNDDTPWTQQYLIEHADDFDEDAYSRDKPLVDLSMAIDETGWTIEYVDQPDEHVSISDQDSMFIQVRKHTKLNQETSRNEPLPLPRPSEKQITDEQSQYDKIQTIYHPLKWKLSTYINGGNVGTNSADSVPPPAPTDYVPLPAPEDYVPPPAPTDFVPLPAPTDFVPLPAPDQETSSSLPVRKRNRRSKLPQTESERPLKLHRKLTTQQFKNKKSSTRSHPLQMKLRTFTKDLNVGSDSPEDSMPLEERKRKRETETSSDDSNYIEATRLENEESEKIKRVKVFEKNVSETILVSEEDQDLEGNPVIEPIQSEGYYRESKEEEVCINNIEQILAENSPRKSEIDRIFPDLLPQANPVARNLTSIQAESREKQQNNGEALYFQQPDFESDIEIVADFSQVNNDVLNQPGHLTKAINSINIPSLDTLLDATQHPSVQHTRLTQRMELDEQFRPSRTTGTQEPQENIDVDAILTNEEEKTAAIDKTISSGTEEIEDLNNQEVIGSNLAQPLFYLDQHVDLNDMIGEEEPPLDQPLEDLQRNPGAEEVQLQYPQDNVDIVLNQGPLGNDQNKSPPKRAYTKRGGQKPTCDGCGLEIAKSFNMKRHKQTVSTDPKKQGRSQKSCPYSYRETVGNDLIRKCPICETYLPDNMEAVITHINSTSHKDKLATLPPTKTESNKKGPNAVE